MIFTLDDVREWQTGVSCTPTALAAISGRTPTDIGQMLQNIAARCGRQIATERNDYAVDDWLMLIKELGGDWVPGDDYSGCAFVKRPLIDDWMAGHSAPDIELIFCDDGAKIGHVFSTHEGKVVDTYTDGKVIEFTAVPDDFQFLRVKRTFIVWDPEPSA
ncbi:MAG: hypothetical protein KJ587_10305 [Alphaproteobacteria bacterium]|nr:hypothetical protein [Alphaproteobacteria bacterium]